MYHYTLSWYKARQIYKQRNKKNPQLLQVSRTVYNCVTHCLSGSSHLSLCAPCLSKSTSRFTTVRTTWLVVSVALINRWPLKSILSLVEARWWQEGRGNDEIGLNNQHTVFAVSTLLCNQRGREENTKRGWKTNNVKGTTLHQGEHKKPNWPLQNGDACQWENGGWWNKTSNLEYSLKLPQKASKEFIIHSIWGQRDVITNFWQYIIKVEVINHIIVTHY